jgi:hypothetical protein
MDPSLPHRDARREAFVQNLFEGKDLYEAYDLAGFKHAKGNAQRMENEPAIAARLAYLRHRLDDLDFLSRSHRRLEVRRALNAIAMVDRTDMFEEVEYERTIGRGEDAPKVKGRYLQLKPLEQLTPEQRQLFEGLGDGGRAVLPAKLAALAQLCKLDGLDAPTKVAPTNPEGDSPYDPSNAMKLVRQLDDRALEKWQQLALEFDDATATAQSGEASDAD